MNLLAKITLIAMLLIPAICRPSICFADSSNTSGQTVQDLEVQNAVFRLNVSPSNTRLVQGEPIEIRFDWNVVGFIGEGKACWLYFGKQRTSNEWVNIEVEEVNGSKQPFTAPKLKPHRNFPPDVFPLSRNRSSHTRRLYFAQSPCITKPGEYKVVVRVDLPYSVNARYEPGDFYPFQANRLKHEFAFFITVEPDTISQLARFSERWEREALSGEPKQRNQAVQSLFCLPEKVAAAGIRRLILAPSFASERSNGALYEEIVLHPFPYVLSALEEKGANSKASPEERDIATQILARLFRDGNDLTKARAQKALTKLKKPELMQQPSFM